MKKNALTITVVANMTSNYSEGLGNISSVQKIYRDRNVYAIRSRESLKNAIMVQSGMYEDLETEANGATQKKVDENLNATNCRALEGGYMNTKESTYVRNSSFYLTDAISTESFINETRFHNNLYLATNYANTHTDKNGKTLNVQKDAGEVGLMPYQYEYEKSFGFDILQDKANSLDYSESLMTHAMVLSGVNILDGKSNRWKVENSWGEVPGNKGYFVMSDAWMDRFTYQIVINKKFLSKEQKEMLNKEVIRLKPWDPMGSLAK